MTTLTAEPPVSRGVALGPLTVAFGTTVAMWAVGYVGRLPAVMLPSPVVAVLMLVCVAAGGFVVGRHGGGWAAGAVTGMITGLLNLLILGSVLGTGERPNDLIPSALWWVPGSIAATAAIAAGAASVGASRPGSRAAVARWTSRFVFVTVAATFLLLAVGGLVTSHDAGLAVVDWPNSYGYNMFLYPLSRMTGGVYYEHAHRLFGALVGLTTLVMAGVLQLNDPRRSVRRLGWLAFAMVAVQGVLGGLRVTGRFTTTVDPAEIAPNVTLAVIHGVLGQVFFALLVGLAVVTSPSWLGSKPRDRDASGSTDRALGALLIGLLLVQLVLGAAQRHLAAMLLLHIALACVVAPLAVAVGARAWGLSPSGSVLHRFGVALVAVTVLQVLLGLGALVATGAVAEVGVPRLVDVTLATAHQWCGAALLACSVATTLWWSRGGVTATGRREPD